jgi:hypothetical protein
VYVLFIVYHWQQNERNDPEPRQGKKRRRKQQRQQQGQKQKDKQQQSKIVKSKKQEDPQNDHITSNAEDVFTVPPSVTESVNRA